jgi:ABC-2 type transport system ATP-binding protein
VAGAGVSVVSEQAGTFEVTGLPSERVGRIAADYGIALAELTPVRTSLEQAFMELTKDAVEYRAPHATAGSAA